METISRPAPRTMAMARSNSSSLRSTMLLPNTMRSSAPVMPSSVMERTAISISGENSSVMAATGKWAGMKAHYRARQCENSRDAKDRSFGGNGAALADPRTGGDRHDDGRRPAPVLRREQSAHPGVHQTGRPSGSGRRVHLSLIHISEPTRLGM